MKCYIISTFDLAEKMEFLSANEDLRGEIGRKAREYTKDFTWKGSRMSMRVFCADCIDN